MIVTAAIVLIIAPVPASVVGASVTPAGASLPTQKLFQADAGPSHGFGTAVAAEGGTLVVGATDPGGDLVASEAIYVYELDETGIGVGPGTWERVQEVAPPDASVTGFGWSLALDGARLVVGAPWTTTDAGWFAGSAHLYERESGSWVHQTELRPESEQEFATFGFAVAQNGDQIVVGAPEFGEAYLFEQVDGTWAQTRVFSGPGLGGAIAIGDRTLAFGGAGGVLVYEEDSGAWSQVAELGAAHGGEGFGRSVALDGDTLAVGATATKGAPDAVDPTNARTGAAYIYQRDGSGDWVEAAKLVPEDVSPMMWDQRFGVSMDLAGDRLLVGAYRDDASPGWPGSPVSQGMLCGSVQGTSTCQSPGAAYAFEKDPGGWVQTAKLSAPDGSDDDGLGSAVALLEDGFAAGAPWDDLTTGEDEFGPGQDIGAVYTWNDASAGGIQ